LTRRGEPFALIGPAGRLEAALHRPAGNPVFRAVVAHPHPLYGGTMDNGVVMLAVGALVAAGGETLRFNFRGVGGSDGEHDEGRGERLDLATAIVALGERAPALPLIVAGYSFGAVMTLDWLSGGADDPAAVLLIAPPVTHYRDRAWSLGAVPSIVVYGERDGLTPPALLEETAARWGSAVDTVMISGVSHDLGSFGAPRGLEAALESAVMSLTASL
jgi:alpha/beta superfamily hydrolase